MYPIHTPLTVSSLYWNFMKEENVNPCVYFHNCVTHRMNMYRYMLYMYTQYACVSVDTCISVDIHEYKGKANKLMCFYITSSREWKGKAWRTGSWSFLKYWLNFHIYLLTSLRSSDNTGFVDSHFLSTRKHWNHIKFN